MTQQRRPKYPMTAKQEWFINKLATDHGLRWAKPYNRETTPSVVASCLIDELQYRFSLTRGLFSRDYLATGIFEIVDQTLAEKF